MNIAKKLALGILSPLFIFLLFATAFDIGFVRTATHPDTVKRLVSESGIYDSVVPSILKQTKSISTDVGKISATDPIIKNAANQALSTEYIQQNTEKIIDNIYLWLDGEIVKPDFAVNLAAVKSDFADSVAVNVKQRLSNLPKCKTAAQVQSFDPLSATCVPSGLNLNQASAEVKKSLSKDKDFLGDVKLDASSIKNEGSKQSLFDDQLKQAPQQYQRLKKTPLILSILTILVGVGIVFLSSTWQKGLRHIGINLAVIGVVMLIFSWALNWAVSNKITPKIKIDNAILQQDIRNLITDLSQQIDKNYWFFGGLYTVLGAGSIAAAEFYRRKNQPARPHATKSALHTESTEERKTS